MKRESKIILAIVAAALVAADSPQKPKPPVADDSGAVAALKALKMYDGCPRDKEGNVVSIRWFAETPHGTPSEERLHQRCLERLRDLPKLRKIKINNEVPDCDMGFICEVSQLETLEITDCDIHDNGLIPLWKLKSLKRLSLVGDHKLTDDSLAYLAGLKTLEVLDASRTHLTGKGLAYLDGLKNLKYLNLRGDSKLDEAALEHIGRLANLEVLILASTGITGEQAKHLKGLTKLKVLDLACTHVTDAAIAEIAGIKDLEALDLYHTPITSASIGDLSRLTRLKNLDINSTGIAEADKEKLRKAIPHVSFASPSLPNPFFP